MADTIASAGRCRGTEHGGLPRIEWDIVKLEDKEGLTPLHSLVIRIELLESGCMLLKNHIYLFLQPHGTVGNRFVQLHCWPVIVISALRNLLKKTIKSLFEVSATMMKFMFTNFTLRYTKNAHLQYPMSNVQTPLPPTALAHFGFPYSSTATPNLLHSMGTVPNYPHPPPPTHSLHRVQGRLSWAKYPPSSGSICSAPIYSFSTAGVHITGPVFTPLNLQTSLSWGIKPILAQIGVAASPPAAQKLQSPT